MPGSPSENSLTSDSDDDKKRTAPSRERITLQQKLTAIQHFDKNRITQKELGDWMYKTFMFKKKLSKSAVANMFRPKDLARIKSFEQQTNPHLLPLKSAMQPRFPQLEEKLFDDLRFRGFKLSNTNAKTTSWVQPLDQGIIRAFKAIYIANITFVG